MEVAALWKGGLWCSEVKAAPGVFDGVRREAIQAGELALAEHALCVLKGTEFCSMALVNGNGSTWFQRSTFSRLYRCHRPCSARECSP